MNYTLTLPQTLTNDIEKLKGALGLKDFETTVQYLLNNAVTRERKLVVVRLYQSQQKTLRQCAELLNVELDEMIEILQEFGVPFHHDDVSDQIETVRQLAQTISLH